MRSALSIYWLFLSGIVLFPATVLAAEGHPVTFPFSDGFEGIRPGMSVTELAAARTNIKPFAFFQQDTSIDPNKPDQVLFEVVMGHAIFETLFYRFMGQELDTIVLTGKLHGEAMPRKVEAFLDMCISTWGKADEALVVALDDPKGATPGAPALMWKKAAAVIVASHTSTENQELLGRGSVQVKIQRCAEEDLADETRCRNVVKKVFSLIDVGVEKKARMLGAMEDRVRGVR